MRSKKLPEGQPFRARRMSLYSQIILASATFPKPFFSKIKGLMSNSEISGNFFTSSQSKKIFFSRQGFSLILISLKIFWTSFFFKILQTLKVTCLFFSTSGPPNPKTRICSNSGVFFMPKKNSFQRICSWIKTSSTSFIFLNFSKVLIA